jgi:hypothetical protein
MKKTKTAVRARRGPLVGVLIVAAAAAAHAPADARVARGCYGPKTTTVVASKDVRVFFHGSDSTGHRKFACFMRTGRMTALGAYAFGTRSPGITNLVATNGRFVAYQRLDCSEGDCRRSEVRRLDARTGTVTRAPQAGPGASGLAGLAVTVDGKVAYLREYDDRTFQLHVFNGLDDRLIDSGAGIAPDSLAFAGPVLYWLKDGAAQSARP